MNTKETRRSWTIHDIARVAKVSAKTVSRVANGEPGVGAATRARVARIIEEVGYQPHTGARSMRCRPRDCIGVAVSAPIGEAPLNQELLTWVFAELYRLFALQGYFCCWDLNPPRSGRTLDYGRCLWQQRVGGCVIVGPLPVDDPTIKRIHDSDCPYVALGRIDSLPEVSHATVDYDEATYMSVKHLLDRGHKRVCLLKGLTNYQPGVERQRGYRRAMAEAGLAPSEELVRPVSFHSRDIADSVHRLLLDHSITAMVDGSGCEDAASIREGARRAGRVPGQDFELVCWTYTHNATILSEACAHIWLPVREAASEGFRLLLRWFEGERPGPVSVLYRPTLYTTPGGEELPRPRRLFELHV